MFIKCINGHLEGGGNGFSNKCPWKSIVPVMRTGIEMTMAFTGGLGGDMPRNTAKAATKPKSVLKKPGSGKASQKRAHSEL